LERGADSSWFMINVLGVWPSSEDGRTYSATILDPCRENWEHTRAEGRFVIGLDPSWSESSRADETAWAHRRGPKVFGLHADRGLSNEAIVEKTIALLRTNRQRNETPILVIDVGGQGGRL